MSPYSSTPGLYTIDHLQVLPYHCRHAYKDHTASGRWFIWMNYTVHAFMYSYYALRSAGVNVPKRGAMFVTYMQISQMIGGVLIAVGVARIKASGGYCQQTWENLYFSFILYFSYFLLFCNFFYHAYLKKNNRYNVVDQKMNKTKKKVMDNGVMDNGVMDNGVMDNGVMDNGVMDNGDVHRESITGEVKRRGRVSRVD